MCCLWVKLGAMLTLLLAVAWFLWVIPEQMMCLRPYGRPRGLLCAVTDVTHVNFKGFLLHFRTPPPKPPPLLLICRMNGESAPHWSGKVCLSFCIHPPSPYPPLPCSPAACTHSQLQTLFFGERGPSQMSRAANSSCSWTSPFFSTKEERGPGSRCTFVQGPSCRFSALCAHWWGCRSVGCSFCLSFVLVRVCKWILGGGAEQAHLAIWSGCAARRYKQVLCLKS